MKHYAVILAGGTGHRMGGGIPKQFLHVNNRPVIAWSIETFIQSGIIDGIIIAIHPEYAPQMEEIINNYFNTFNVRIVHGGATRQESSFNALNSYPFLDNDVILIHDAARPFITVEMIKECIQETVLHGAVGVYVPVKETIAHIDNGNVKTVLPRQTLYAAQTPQCFSYSVIMDAHRQAVKNNLTNATDDVTLVLNAGYSVKAITGNHYYNIKITTNDDFALAEWLSQNRSRIS